MTNKTKLVQILNQYCFKENSNFIHYFTQDECENLANYLLENNIVILPCKLNQVVYELFYNHCCTDPSLDYYDLHRVPFTLDMWNKIGDTIFLTYEEAVIALNIRRKINDKFI